MIDLIGYLIGIMILAFVIRLAFYSFSQDVKETEQNVEKSPTQSNKIKTEQNTTKALAQFKVRAGQTSTVQTFKGPTVYSVFLSGELKTLLIYVKVKSGKIETSQSRVLDFENVEGEIEFSGNNDFNYRVVVAKVEPQSDDPEQFYSVLIYKK